MHPYQNLDERCFWAPAVAQRDMLDIADLWDPRFLIRSRDPVSTFGSCFAQHIGRALHARGFHWLITERAPWGLSAEDALRFNYGVFSARTGNIYTVSLLRQWVGWATDPASVPDDVWEKDGRFYDPWRPNIEPDGFASAEEVRISRGAAVRLFRECIERSAVFVFTMGLTESWWDDTSGLEYPMCPGTVAGTYSAKHHQFVNQDFVFIRENLAKAMKRMRKINPALRFILTVSPVPLTATMSGQHVLVATMESKSTLRAVAGVLVKQFDFVDYFPSYEIINAAPFGGKFFERNQRSVTQEGVGHVMDMFFSCLAKKFPESAPRLRPGGRRDDRNEDQTRPHQPGEEPPPSPDDVVCEEQLLAAFAGGSKA